MQAPVSNSWKLSGVARTRPAHRWSASSWSSCSAARSEAGREPGPLSMMESMRSRSALGKYLSLAQRCPFGLDGGVITVPGVDHRLTGQREQTVADRRDDEVNVAVGPSGGARAALEERVAGEDAAEVGREQADRPRGVAGRVEHG